MKRSYLRAFVAAVVVTAVAVAALVAFGSPLSSTPAASVSAAPLAVSYTSDFTIQNLDTANQASVKIDYYDSTTGNAAGSVSCVIAAGGKLNVPWDSSLCGGQNLFPVPTGFAGSAVVSSDRPVAAISNLQTEPYGMWASFVGIVSTSTTMNVPLAMKANSGWSTTIFVQNAGLVDATNVTVVFKDIANVTKDTVVIPLIKPGATAILPQATQTTLPTGYYGAVRITSAQPLAAAVNSTNGSILLAQAGAATGAQKIFAPVAMAANNGWDTDFNVVNIGAPTTLFLKKGQTIVDTVPNVGTGQLVVWGGTWSVGRPSLQSLLSPAKYGSFSVEGANVTDQLVGVVNETHKAFGQGMAYQMLSGGTQKLNAPLIMASNSQWFTDWTIMNVGSTDTVVTLFKDGVTNVGTMAIPAGGTSPWRRSEVGTTLGTAYYGSYMAVGANAGDKLVGMVNQVKFAENTRTSGNTASGGDYSMVYEAINQ